METKAKTKNKAKVKPIAKTQKKTNTKVKINAKTKTKANKKEKQARRNMYGVIVNKPSNFYMNLLSDDAYEKMKEMNTSDGFILKWQQQRVLYSAILGIVVVIIGFYIKMPMISLFGPLLAFVWFFMKGKSIDQNYMVYKFNRALEFAKFTRLVVPYLRSDSNGGSESRVYTTLSAVVGRLDTKEDRQLLATLLYEMTQRPGDKQPYVDYAMKVGGTDFAITFMETIYDIRQGSANLNIVERLSRESNEQVQGLMKDIVRMKNKKLLMIATKATMPVMIIILGSIVAIAVQSFSGVNINLGGLGGK